MGAVWYLEHWLFGAVERVQGVQLFFEQMLSSYSLAGRVSGTVDSAVKKTDRYPCSHTTGILEVGDRQ